MIITRLRTWTIVVAVAAAAITLLLIVAPVVPYAIRSESTHVALETAGALIALVAAYLVIGRSRRSWRLTDVVLAGALGLIACTNFAFSTIPAIAEQQPSPFATWSALIGGMAGAGMLAIAAFTPPRPVRRRRRAVTIAIVAPLAAVGVIAGLVALAGGHLPVGIDPMISPKASPRPLVVGNATLLGVQLLTAFYFAVAAFGFTRQAHIRSDELLQWVALGAVLAAASRVNYFLFASLYSPWVYAGDFFRLGFYVVLLVGTVREIGAYQRDLAESATLDERQRLAREIHDGLAQELAFIVSQSQRLAAGDDSERLAPVTTAARRALDEARMAIGALTRPADESLELSLAHAAEDVADRAGAAVHMSYDERVELPAPARDALSRIVREAVNNAVRHGGARNIDIAVRNGKGIEVRIADDGDGFVHAPAKGAGFGLVSMMERAQKLGGELEIASEPGKGTEVKVVLP
jgi:signal transduction histidine kinase